MTDSIMSKAATMEIPINSNGDTGTLPEDDSLEQVGLPAQRHDKASFLRAFPEYDRRPERLQSQRV